MPASDHAVDVYLEVGKQRVVAGALAWPGWCRGARGEEQALQALFEAGPRYARVLEAARIPFTPPPAPAALAVVERLAGNASTDYGVPDLAPAEDARPLDDEELQRQVALLGACWRALDAAVAAARGHELRKGPRGGGRELDGIVQHVLGAEQSYLGRLAWKVPKDEARDLAGELERTRAEVRSALERAARGEMPAQGPRGGKLWAPRYFVRRAAWHVLDHAWEIEDRVLLSPKDARKGSLSDTG